MNRRTFLTALGIAPAAAKALPAIPTADPVLSVAPAIATTTILLPNQSKLFECDAPEILLTGGPGGGITFAVREWLMALSGTPGYRGLYIDAANRRPDHLYGEPLPVIETSAVAVIRDHLVRGWHFSRIVINNAIEWEYGEGEYVRLMDCLRAHEVPVKPQIVVVAVPNPNMPAFSWIKRRFIDDPHPYRAVISLNITDRPALDSEYIKALEAMEPPKQYWLEGKWK